MIWASHPDHPDHPAPPTSSTSTDTKHQLIVPAYGEANDDGVDEFLEPIPHHIHLHVHEISGTSACHGTATISN